MPTWLIVIILCGLFGALFKLAQIFADYRFKTIAILIILLSGIAGCISGYFIAFVGFTIFDVLMYFPITGIIIIIISVAYTFVGLVYLLNNLNIG
jgi:hypothetical protein